MFRRSCHRCFCFTAADLASCWLTWRRRSAAMCGFSVTALSFSYRLPDYQSRLYCPRLILCPCCCGLLSIDKPIQMCRQTLSCWICCSLPYFALFRPVRFCACILDFSSACSLAVTCFVSTATGSACPLTFGVRPLTAIRNFLFRICFFCLNLCVFSGLFVDHVVSRLHVAS